MKRAPVDFLAGRRSERGDDKRQRQDEADGLNEHYGAQAPDAHGNRPREVVCYAHESNPTAPQMMPASESMGAYLPALGEHAEGSGAPS